MVSKYSMEERKSLAAVLRFFARVMEQAPDVEHLEELETVSSQMEEGKAFWDANKDRDRKELSIELRVEWTKLFRGISPTYGPRPPYEFVYKKAADESVTMLTMNNLYAKQGLSLSRDAHNRPDYLGFELEFAAFYLEEGTEEALGELQKFIAGHLDWVDEYCTDALTHAETGFYRWFLTALPQIIHELAE